MKLSFDWLSDYVDLSGLTPQEVAEKLTMGAFEVEEITTVGADIEGEVIVGEIVEINPHPNADKIRLTKIRLAEGTEPREIVCGAWNIEVGNRIPVALPGAKVINRHDGTALLIKESKIRGVTSNGMLCSPPELGIPGGGDGILILANDTALGADVKAMFNLYPDYVLHVEPRSNRGDGLSVIGMAREVAALFGRPLKEPQWQLPEAQADDSFAVSIEDESDCPFFTARIITDLKSGPSPAHIVRRLEAIGVRTVSNIVDVTNYVMHELGQPLHAYDIRTVSGKRLGVRRARAGEKLRTIDDKERALTDEVLVIADENGVTGVAGVMGGKESEIAGDTVAIALEAAAFNSARVRRASRLLGLSSDSSQRFERGVDIASVRKASDRAAYLMLEHCGGKLGKIFEQGSDKLKSVTVNFRLSELKRITELELSADQTTKLLTPLGFRVTEKDGNLQEVEVPSFRQKDVTREIDIIEEVLRLWGYDKVPASMPRRTVAPPMNDTTFSRVRQALSASGLNEAWISSLISLEDLEGKGLVKEGAQGAIGVLNPLSEEHQVLRTSLIPGLLKAVAYNQDHGRQDVWLFEVGRTYFKAGTPGSTEARDAEPTTQTREIDKAAGVICGHYALSSWLSSSGRAESGQAVEGDFFLGKGIVENLLRRLGVNAQSVSYKNEGGMPGWFHPSRSAAIAISGQDKRKSTTVGHLGELHPALVDSYQLRKSAQIFELDLSAISQLSRAAKFQEIYNTPVVMRDVTPDLPKHVSHAAIAECIKAAAGPLLKNLELVSVFELSDDKRSLSYRLTFQSKEATLVAEEVEKNVQEVRQRLAKELSASFRV